MPKILLQPRQRDIWHECRFGRAPWVGIGGGRGAAKSQAIDRIAIIEMMREPIVAAIVMRTYDQVRKYHIDPLSRSFPELLEDYYTISSKKLKIPVEGGFSELDIGYAENYAAVENFFRSGNYKYIFIDQAEQFTERELKEIKKAARWPGGRAKLVLFFNMGGVGIEFLRRIFHERKYNERADPEDYVFLKVNPWDNVFWSTDALQEDSLTVKDYYSWTDTERMEYAGERGEYTRQLNQDDDALRLRDWFGSWDALEGAYFGKVFDRDAMLLDQSQIKALMKPWHPKWMSQDWGKAHFCVTHWHTKLEITPRMAAEVLGWKTERQLQAVVTYREMAVNEMSSEEVAREMVARTPQEERKPLSHYYLSPDAFGERDSSNTIAMNQGRILTASGLPQPFPADTDHIGGYGLMYSLMMNTKSHGVSGDPIWLVGPECPEILNAIPLLMRDPKNLDDVIKTDKSSADLKMDAADSARYGLKSMLSPGRRPQEERLQEALQDIPVEGTAKFIAHQKFLQNERSNTGGVFYLRGKRR